MDDGFVLKRVNDTLSASKDERDRAVALLFESVTLGAPNVDQTMQQSSASCTGGTATAANQACEEAQRRLESALARRAVQAAPSVDRLARMAVSSADPFVYSLALQACHFNRPASPANACSQLSLDQWGRLDPTNGAVWLHALEQATAKQDTSAVTDALYRLSKAEKFELPAFTASTLVLHALPMDLSEDQALRATVHASTVWTQWQLPAYQPLVSQCGVPWIRDANRAQTCDAIARVMVEREQAAIGVLIGARLGEQLGWPSERVNDIRVGVRAVLAAAPALMVDDEQSVSTCGLRRRLRDWMELVAQRGEFRGTEEHARRAGLGIEQLKTQYLAGNATIAASSPSKP